MFLAVIATGAPFCALVIIWCVSLFFLLHCKSCIWQLFSSWATLAVFLLLVFWVISLVNCCLLFPFLGLNWRQPQLPAVVPKHLCFCVWKFSGRSCSYCLCALLLQNTLNRTSSAYCPSKAMCKRNIMNVSPLHCPRASQKYNFLPLWTCTALMLDGGECVCSEASVCAWFGEWSLPLLSRLSFRVVEVRTLEPRMLVQSFSLDKARFICAGR